MKSNHISSIKIDNYCSVKPSLGLLGLTHKKTKKKQWKTNTAKLAKGSILTLIAALVIKKLCMMSQSR